MYRIIIENKAAKEIDSVPDDVLQLVVNAVEDLKSNPRPHGVKKLIGQNGWRIRVRTYRILFTIDDSRKVVSIYRVKHRREAYR